MLPFFIFPSLYAHFGDRLPDTFLDPPLALLAIALSIWGLVELYVLRGGRQPNRFSADPLTEIADELRAARTPAWDQRNELEFVPPSASPPGGMHVRRGS